MSVSLTPAASTGTSFKPGDTATFEVRLTNNGPGDASGITVAVVMPSTFRYRATDQIQDAGSARTQPLDARVGSSDPQWGFWDIGAPTSAEGTSVVIDFSVQVGGAPGPYNLSARAQGDNTSGVVSSKPLPVQLQSAPNLAVQARADTTSLADGATTTYRVTITNSGSGAAGNVSLLVTLPPIMVFQSSLTPFQSNGSHSATVTPYAGGVLVFYGGLNLPASGGGGPGYVVVAFRAQVVNNAASGTYTISGQVTDTAGDTIPFNNAAPVTVHGF